MWTNFFAAGGFGMYPVSIFGFLLIGVCVLYALRPQQKTARMAVAMGICTFGAGLLGTATGVCTTMHYVPQVAQDKQVEIMGLGIEESLHNMVLALILIILGTLIAAGGTLRAPTTAQTA
jgi:hypothetical protein